MLLRRIGNVLDTGHHLTFHPTNTEKLNKYKKCKRVKKLNLALQITLLPKPQNEMLRNPLCSMVMRTKHHFRYAALHASCA